MKTYTAKVKDSNSQIIGECVKEFQQFLKDDRKDGAKHVSYTVLHKAGIITAYDTEEQFHQNGDLLAQQGFTEYRVVEGVKVPGVRNSRLHIWTMPEEDMTYENRTNDLGFFLTDDGSKACDSVSWLFGYMPGGWDFVVAEVFFEPVRTNGNTNLTPKKKKRK